MQTKFKNHEIRWDLMIYYGKAVKNGREMFWTIRRALCLETETSHEKFQIV
jgi:hypothetical protein